MKKINNMIQSAQKVDYFSERGKKIMKLIAIGVGVFLAYKFYQNWKANDGREDEVQEAYNELDTLNQNNATKQKITKYQAEQYANGIYTAVNGYGTDETSIEKIFWRLYNNADFLAVSKAYGIRKISSGYLNPEPDYKGTMTESLHIDLSSYYLTRINNILKKKKIKFRI